MWDLGDSHGWFSSAWWDLNLLFPKKCPNKALKASPRLWNFQRCSHLYKIIKLPVEQRRSLPFPAESPNNRVQWFRKPAHTICGFCLKVWDLKAYLCQEPFAGWVPKPHQALSITQGLLSGPPFQQNHHGQQLGTPREILQSPCPWAHQAVLGGGHLFKEKSLKKRLVWRESFSPDQAQRKLPGSTVSWEQKHPTRRVNFVCSSSVLIFKYFQPGHEFSRPCPAEDSLVGHEDLGPFCSKYNISPQMIFFY